MGLFSISDHLEKPSNFPQRQFPLVYIKKPSLKASISSFMMCWKDDQSPDAGSHAVTVRSPIADAVSRNIIACARSLRPRASSKLRVRRVIYRLCCPLPTVFLKSWQLFSKILLIRPCADYKWVHIEETHLFSLDFLWTMLGSEIFASWHLRPNIKRIFLQRISCCYI